MADKKLPPLIDNFGNSWEELETVRPPKKPGTPFPACSPENCGKKCTKVYEHHNEVMSLAMYSENANSRKVCVYAYCCGMEILGAKVIIQPGENAIELVQRIAKKLVQEFINVSLQIKQEEPWIVN